LPLLHEAYGQLALSRDRVFEWHKRFSEVREDVEDDERPGRQVTMKTDENLENVRTIVGKDRHIGIRMTTEELNLDKETVRQILTTNLNTKTECAKMAPKNPPVLATKQIPKHEHAPSSTDHDPCQFFLFPK
jgi:hypothetical protein